ncbi:MAG TPA: carboxyl transferase domain-containing protein [Candidatus Binataceae bacterium]|nr:carboxyl transferase domain-containing protein [Candidatus Binataceae bacterium]
MSWQPEIDEIKRRLATAKQMGGAENIKRQHDAGKLTVRERIERLLDPGSFHEYGALAASVKYEGQTLVSSMPANFVGGTGRIEGRMVAVGGDDFTVRGGAADASIGNKQSYFEMLAHELRIPIVRLVDGTGGGGSVRSLDSLRRTYVPANPAFDILVKLLAEVPVIAGCMGSVAGLGAARVAASHFSVMVRGTSQLFVAGPPVVKWGTGEDLTKEALGGSEIHAHGSGAVDNEAENEDDAFAQIRRFLSYMPQSVWQVPPYLKPDDDPNRREAELIEIVPRNRRQGYDSRRIVECVMDRDSFFEIARDFGPSLITGLARLDGYPVGVMANDPYFIGGSLDAAGSDKMVKFVDLCDTFHLPVVNFVDQPGFLIGLEAESQGTIRHGVRALCAVFQTITPWVAIMVRRCFGVAGAGHGITTGLNLRYAWPSADWGSLPIEGGIEAAYKRDLAASSDPEKLRRELEEKFNAVRSPIRTAEAFGIEEIIDPRDTRPILCEWVHQAYEIVPTQLGLRSRTMRP